MTDKRTQRDPQLRLYKRTGKGRVILSGQHFYTEAPFGTRDALEEYLELMRRWEANGRQSLRRVQTPPQLDNPRTVGDLIDAYLAHVDQVGLYRKNGRKTTQRDLIDVALEELRAGFGGTPLHKFRKQQLTRHRDVLLARRPKNEKDRTRVLTPQGVNRKINLIRQAIDWGGQRGFVPDECVASVQVLKMLRSPNRGRREPVPDDHVEKVVARLSRPLAAMVRLQRETGMRPGEVCAMRWRGIDTDPADLRGRELALWRYTVDSPKTQHLGDETSYLLNGECQRILGGFRKPKAAFIFSPKETVLELWPDSHELLGRTGDRYSVAAYRQAVGRACVSVGVPVFTPHQLRHAFITEVANDPALGLAAASEAANHRSQRSTLGYVHRQRELAVRVATTRHREAAGH
jgi:integrase